MAVYLAWSDTRLEAVDRGPWTALHHAAAGVMLVDSSESLSRVYHEIKWSLPEGATLLVAPLAACPKLAHMAAGTQSWLRERLST